MRGAPALSRREFLEVSVAAAGGLLVSCRSLPEPGVPAAAAAVDSSAGDRAGPAVSPGVFNVYLEVALDNRVYITTPQTEMGQGVHDSLTKIVAEELDADWSRVTVRLPYSG